MTAESPTTVPSHPKWPHYQDLSPFRRAKSH